MRSVVLAAALGLAGCSGDPGTGSVRGPLRLEALSPTTVGGAAGRPIASPPSVRVIDVNSGEPKAGVAVTFAVTSGGGSLTGGFKTTDTSGVATVGSWTLGATPGENTLTATAQVDLGSPITFTATGNAAPAAAKLGSR